MRYASFCSAFLVAALAHAQPPNYAVDLVNPFVGTGGHGHTFPGACVPNGLVQLSPDTRPDGYSDWDGCGGYHYSDSVIHGFSHTHLSGTGVADLCDVLVMPVASALSTDPAEYRSRFDHASEVAHAGYYKVHLDRPDVDAELTSTARAGMHRYTFPQGSLPKLVLDLRHRDDLLTADIQVIGDSEIVGERRSSSWARDQRLFFCMRVDRPILLNGNGAQSSRTMEKKGNMSAAGMVAQAFTFADNGRPLLVKVGISAVSIEGARRNLDAEVPGWDFDLVRKQAEAAWNAKLSKIQVTGGTREQQRVFYTALYHCYVAPYVFNDVDGSYRGMDGQVHRADHNVYTVFSLWDTFRALHPLMTILEPDMTNDFIKTFLLNYQQGGKLPVWELWGNETNCMIGYHSVSVIADAYMKGIRGFDEQLAIEAMRASAQMDEPGLRAYRSKGFISSEDESDDVSKTLEYSFDDACIHRMQREAHHDPGGEDFGLRSNNHLNLFDPETGFYRPRRNGGFIPGFDPFEVNFHFTEANAWQYSLFPPHTYVGRFFGDETRLKAHLDKLFAASTNTSGREQADITGLIGQYAHGNEPSHHMIYLYHAAGEPQTSRKLAKRVMDEFYRDDPDGLIGNEDCGQMSAWFVMSALGLYQIAPGVDDDYVIGHPLFTRASVSLADGKSWLMAVDTLTNEVPRIAGIELGTYQLKPDHIHHSTIVHGGGLAFNKDRVAFMHDPGPLVLDGAYVKQDQEMPCSRPGAPIIEAASSVFTDSLLIRIIGQGTCTVTEGGVSRAVMPCEPFHVHTTADVSVAWSTRLAPVTAHFKKMDGGRTIKLESQFANQYSAGGDQALIDGLRGGRDFRTGEWQGYQGQDVTATVDLGKVKKLKRVGVGALQEMRAWIWYPGSVEISWSTNGRKWKTQVVVNSVDRKADGGMTQELWTQPLNAKARYVRIKAKNAGPCPDWHLGRGGSSWIFLDEILIEAE